jgi:hypothetical protein
MMLNKLDGRLCKDKRAEMLIETLLAQKAGPGLGHGNLLYPF